MVHSGRSGQGGRRGWAGVKHHLGCSDPADARRIISRPVHPRKVRVPPIATGGHFRDHGIHSGRGRFPGTHTRQAGPARDLVVRAQVDGEHWHREPSPCIPCALSVRAANLLTLISQSGLGCPGVERLTVCVYGLVISRQVIYERVQPLLERR